MSRMASEQEPVPNPPTEGNPQNAPEVVPKDKPTEEPKPDQAEAKTYLSSSGDSSPPAAIPTTTQDADPSHAFIHIEQVDGSKNEADM
ncbi:hypothetical protein SARC_02618 [Sphaeroforma arctica JP610]|uniref:Uncharacterized protein n=1 Tax=Sphaeroforma arctica JP610 TaxID=667725 RepID=A0A0L0G8G6_9EUKA|nr:hypothetical protein SARC_02618 [Sphaeroforma arctica JP610]KNC85199.1 hypothetical protein SARC_02618 [Sphaeroforma arctica JP610]|eukprot:XP_014159101.1 hypothetical protein SARC_02618 [Sphaeroforma arctica JP610]